MKIIEYFESNDKSHWLGEIGKSTWSAGIYLYELLRDNKLKDLCGQDTRVLLLTDGENLVSFCTYAPQDDIPNPNLTPWLGFVFTFPRYRGQRCFGHLVDHAITLAKADGFSRVYVSTLETGLYEKYGFRFLKMMPDVHGDDSKVYVRDF